VFVSFLYPPGMTEAYCIPVFFFIQRRCSKVCLCSIVVQLSHLIISSASDGYNSRDTLINNIMEINIFEHMDFDEPGIISLSIFDFTENNIMSF
jgi:hypothetical protein